ncbi:MAG TPA: fructosamine kinase family protein [Kofleriaceae bacterium]|jgi:fructosamine-3-kinase|nr:fructosamine kinase family protein [Kofleriaceae bacterium]
MTAKTDALADAVAAAAGAPPRRLTRVHGGDINEAYRAELADGRTVFVKHHAAPPAGMFAAEAWGLGWLVAAGAIRVPAVIGHGDHVLVLEWLAPAARDAGFAAALGRGLAGLHRAGAPSFGLDHPSFIATIAQDNTACATWTELWIERRLRPLVERAIAAGRGPARWRQTLDDLAVGAGGLAPDEPPARLHGDLWSGNVHATAGGPALVDPAVYGGPREVDLAMLDLFGGLDPATLDAYDEVWPLAPGLGERLPLWQLYPLLVHVVLFGGSYAAAVDAAFGRYL